MLGHSSGGFDYGQICFISSGSTDQVHHFAGDVDVGHLNHSVFVGVRVTGVENHATRSLIIVNVGDPNTLVKIFIDVTWDSALGCLDVLLENNFLALIDLTGRILSGVGIRDILSNDLETDLLAERALPVDSTPGIKFIVMFCLRLL